MNIDSHCRNPYTLYVREIKSKAMKPRTHIPMVEHLSFIRVHCFLALLFSLIMASKSVYGQGTSCIPNWSESIQLSSDSVVSISPRIASDRNIVHVIWYGLDTIGNANNTGIQYAYSIDSGQTFYPQRTILSPNTAFSPGYLSCSGDFVYIVCTGMVNSTLGTVFRRGTVEGNSWDDPTMLMANSLPQLIVSVDSKVFVYFTASTTNKYGLLQSNDYGTTWNVKNSNMPMLTGLIISEDGLHGIGNVSVGTHQEVGYYYSTNSGLSWIGPEIVSPEDGVASMSPRIAIATNSTRFVIWNELGDILLRQSDGYDEEGYLRWKPQRVIAEETNAVYSDIAMSGNIISIIWEEHTGDTSTIQNSTSPNRGKNFCPAVSPTIGIKTGEPASVLAGSLLHLVWSEELNSNQEIFYRQRQLAEIQTPTKIELTQNYPNPAEAATFINYKLPAATHVTLTMYNILGQRIAILVNQLQDEGEYTIAWNDQRAASGVYFYRLSTPTYSETRKLVKVR